MLSAIRNYTCPNSPLERGWGCVFMSCKWTVDSLQCFLDYILIQKSHINTRWSLITNLFLFPWWKRNKKSRPGIFGDQNRLTSYNSKTRPLAYSRTQTVRVSLRSRNFGISFLSRRFGTPAKSYGRDRISNYNNYSQYILSFRPSTLDFITFDLK